MANYPVYHGIKLAKNAFFENFNIEILESDPVVTSVGRSWFNSTSKTWKFSTLDSNDNLVVRSFSTKEDFDNYINSVFSTAANKGTNLIGYDGKTADNFSITAGTLKSALDNIVLKISDNTKSILDIGTGNLVAIQSEIDNTQSGAGLSITGSYVPNDETNYIKNATSLFDADVKLDNQLKIISSNLQSELDTTQAGAGLNPNGTYVVNSSANYISNATSLSDADNKLDTALKNAVISLTNAINTETQNRTTEDISIRSDFTAADNLIRSDLASNEEGKGASLIGINSTLFNSTDVENALLELKDNINSVTLQDVYNNSFTLSEGLSYAGIKLTNNKPLIILDNNDDTFFKLDPSGTDPISVTMTGTVSVSGDMTISGNLLVNGTTTEINSTITNADHFRINPAGEVPAITIEPLEEFTGNTVVSIKAVKNGPNVLELNKNDSTIKITKLHSTTSAIFSNEFEIKSDTNVKFGGNRITNVAAGINSNDVVIKSQLDSVVTNSTSIQSELDTTQAGAGLSATGTYVADVETNYIKNATSLFDADIKLDSKIKGINDSLTTEISNREFAINALTLELDTTQTGAGLSNTGQYIADSNSNYLKNAVSLFDADIKLDAQLKNITTNLQSELDNTQNGAGLNVNGIYVANTETNYIKTAVSLFDADIKLDQAIKDVSVSLFNEISSRNTTVSSLQSEIDLTQIGAGLTETGVYVPSQSSNYIKTATSLFNADILLDSQIKTLSNALDAEITNRINSIALESNIREQAINQVRYDINNLNYTYLSNSPALVHTINHNLNASFIDYTILVEGEDSKFHSDVCLVTELSSNALMVTLTESRNIKVVIRKVANI